nr:unnamed protein product [Naegleria fowleri]
MQNKRQALQSKIEFLLSQLTHSYPPLCDDYSKNNKNEHLAQQNLDLRFQLLKLQQLLLKSDNQELLNKCDQEWMTILMNFNEMKNAFPTLRHHFQEISQLNAQVKQAKDRFSQKLEMTDRFYEQLYEGDLESDILTRIQEQLLMNPFDKCHSNCQSHDSAMSITKYSITNEQHTQLFHSLFTHYQQLKDIILESDYVQLLNELAIKAEDHIEKITNFLQSLELFDLRFILNFGKKMRVLTFNCQISNGLEEGHSHEGDMSLLNEMIQQTKLALMEEERNLSEIELSKKFPQELFDGLVGCISYYRHVQQVANSLVQECIPLIFQKHKYYEHANEWIQKFPSMKQRMDEITKKKRSIERSIKKINIEIEGLKEDLIGDTDVQQQELLKKEISEKELEILTKKQEARQWMNESNEIRLKLLTLRQLGFSDVFSHLSEESAPILGIPELSCDFFKKISPLSGWSGNHSVFEGIDFQSKRYIIKQYQVRDHKDLDKLKKELKILQKIKHRNIVTIEGYYLETNSSHN